ncbi:MAG: acyltransferase [Chitinophagaceae bacterium]|nr:acyltransferase [Chitinophagaceae bacterium]
METVRFPGSKPHYETLDGMRGLAAICIVFFHFFEYTFPDYKKSPLGHGYLAVDFFFALSGFVIGYAYDERIKTIGTGRFLLQRLIRLHPMVVFGGVLGFAAYIFNPLMDNIALAGWGKIILSFVATLLLLPMPGLPNTAGNVFPLNPPSWSLSTEYLANIFYAFVLCRLSKKLLLFVFLCFGGWLIYVAYARGWLIEGWEGNHYFDGWARTAFSFTAGLVLFRFKLVIRNRINMAVLLLLLAGVFASPHADNDWIRESVIVIVVFPLLISLAAGAVVGGWIKRFCVFIGRLSYPLYMVHYAVVALFGFYYNQYKPSGAEVSVWVAGASIIIFGLTYVVMRFYDEPVRRYLVRKWVNIRQGG